MKKILLFIVIIILLCSNAWAVNLVCDPYPPPTDTQAQPEYFRLKIDSGTYIISTAVAYGDQGAVRLQYNVDYLNLMLSHRFEVDACMTHPATGLEVCSTPPAVFISPAPGVLIPPSGVKFEK